MSCFIFPPESQAMRGLLSYLLRPRSQQLTFTRPCPRLLRKKNAFLLTLATWRAIPETHAAQVGGPKGFVAAVPKWTIIAPLQLPPRSGRARANSGGCALSTTDQNGCVGQDSNLGTPSGRDLESLAFDRAWLPTRSRGDAGVRKTFPVAAVRTRFAKDFCVTSVGSPTGDRMVRYFSKEFFD